MTVPFLKKRTEEPGQRFFGGWWGKVMSTTLGVLNLGCIPGKSYGRSIGKRIHVSVAHEKVKNVDV